MKIISCPATLIPTSHDDSNIYLSQYTKSADLTNGYFGLNFPNQISKSGISPSIATWDFATFALSIAAIDKVIPRTGSADGWTRVLDVVIHLNNPNDWYGQERILEELLRFLTGDFWYLEFKEGGTAPPESKNIDYNADCVSLLSGGVDSLVGAIDLVEQGRKPVFVSHVVNGSANAQGQFAYKLNAENRFFQWSFGAKLICNSESSTRGRSMVFYAFAAIAATVLPHKNNLKDVVVPENGFISLNIPLSPGRIGSLSTRTTHPIFMKGIQQLWAHLGIPLKLRLPYQFKTKGEMLNDCLNQELLKELIGQSVSCGKYIRTHKHCGVCIPCLVRRGAFLKCGLIDTTPVYINDNLKESSSDNIAVLSSTYVRLNNKSKNHVIGGSLNFAKGKEKKKYEDVFIRGLFEMYELLIKYKKI